MAVGARALVAMLFTGCFIDAVGLADGSGASPDGAGPTTGGQAAGGQSAGGDPSSGGEGTGGQPTTGGASSGGGPPTGGGGGEGGEGGAPQPCTEVSLWDSGATPVEDDYNDARAVEVGVRFRSDVSGQIRAIRFYKGGQNTGTHVGHLWSSGGQLLASATFSGESGSGWQQASFPSPVPIDANTTYVASYHAPGGYYAADAFYFAGAGVDSPPLRAPQDGDGGPNGVYQYGSSAFPDQTYLSHNYWVDVVLCY